MAVPVRRLTNSSGTLNTITPCAACKFLRRRCAQDCPFLPYFSPNEPHNFVAVHKVFGASNVSKLLMEVPESKRVDAARSLVYEANLRLLDPIYGCMGVIFSLQERVKSLQAELEQVSSDILKHKYHKQATFANQPFGDMPMASSSVSVPASLSSLYDAPRSSSAHGDYVNNSSTSYENVTYFG